jgi:hypothetical protein
MVFLNDNSAHEKFGELIALAAVGQVSPKEYQELRAHLEVCAACRQEYQEFDGVLVNHLPLAYDDFNATAFPAVERDNPLTPQFWTRLWRIPASVPAYAFTLLLLWLGTAGFFGWKILEIKHQLHAQADDAAQWKEENATLRDQIANLPRRRISQAPEDASATGKLSGGIQNASSNMLASLQAQNRKLSMQYEALQRQFAGTTSDANKLRDEIASGTEREQDLTAQLTQTQNSLAQANTQLDAERTAHAQEAAASVTEKSHVQDLEVRLAVSEDAVERGKQLLAADRDIRDLMGARDLFISEVYEVNGNGRKKKPYGRVFYTKGRSLIFYAYDLDQQPGLKAASTFQAWGMRGGDRSTALNLGVLYADSSTNKRWVLRFDDPKALEQVNAVFVTVEPNGESRTPRGKEVLFAYLNEEPNHP